VKKAKEHMERTEGIWLFKDLECLLLPR